MPDTFQISRRSFIKRCSLTAAVTGLPLWLVERDLARAAERVRAAKYPQAEEFATKYILQPPIEAEMLELFTRVEIN